MTTEQPPTRDYAKTSPTRSIVRRTLVTTLVFGLGAVLLAVLLADLPAAAGAVIGTVMVCVFFGFGAVVLDLVSRLAPAASLLVALLTYTLKVVLIGLVFVVLSGSGALDGGVDAVWLGGTVIVCTLGWLVCQVFFSVRSREPLYDLPSHSKEGSVR